ncbi:LolA family protein, partial [Neisseria sp. P0015.S002]|uniref:LolA family protein n=1 Tax=Neisseria sp. P0015.S002 TaxID=3436758 RepID=UPI003F811048
LEKQFDLKLNGNEKKRTLTLTPKNAITRQIFNRIEINVDTLVRKIELDEKQGDKNIMQFKQNQTDKAHEIFTRNSL